MKALKAFAAVICVGVSHLFCSCGTLGQDFWTAMAGGVAGAYSTQAQPMSNSYQSATTSGTQLGKADNQGGAYVGNKYVNLNAYGATTDGMMINTINSGSAMGGGYVDTSTSTTSSSSKSTTSSSSKPRQCTICSGTGKVKRSLPSSSYGLDTSKKRCSTCGEMMMAPGHTHITCTNCKGTGMVKRYSENCSRRVCQNAIS